MQRILKQQYSFLLVTYGYKLLQVLEFDLADLELEANWSKNAMKELKNDLMM